MIIGSYFQWIFHRIFKKSEKKGNKKIEEFYFQNNPGIWDEEILDNFPFKTGVEGNHN